MLLCSISCVSTGAVGTTKGVFTVCVFVMAYSMMAGIIGIYGDITGGSKGGKEWL